MFLRCLSKAFSADSDTLEASQARNPSSLTGDSLLFAAGAFASLGHLNLAALLAIFISSAILGDALNYQLGNLWGKRCLALAAPCTGSIRTDRS